MSNNHVITREIGNLRGFSTDSIYLRPPNVADSAINLQRSPEGTLQIRRGYQCQIAKIGGMGNGTFDDPSTDEIHTVTLGLDGYLYNKLTRQIFFYYDGQVLGNISNVTNANPAVLTSISHRLQTGAKLILRNIGGMTPLNNKKYTITVIDVDHFSLDGIDTSNTTLFPPYTNGGYWSIAFADNRYLVMTIFTDPRFLVTNPGWSVAAWSLTPWGSPSGESITCNLTINRAAQVVGEQLVVNTVNVEFGHELAPSDIIQFYSKEGVFNQRNVISITTTSITFDGYAVSFSDGSYISQFFDIPFRRGFDVSSPYLISTFIATITNSTTGVKGLQVSINGLDNLPAAFLQIFEPQIIDSNRFYSSAGWSYDPWSISPWGSPSSSSVNKFFSIDYWYWEKINFTFSPPFPRIANQKYQNSPDFENASMDVWDDVIYVADGLDYPQKYDGQTVYRAGMPQGVRPSATDNTTFISQPFVAGNIYQYAITYEQIDNRGHIVEGELSEIRQFTVSDTNAAIDVEVENIISGLVSPVFGNNWNTNAAIALGGIATSYGPDINGFYYNLVDVFSGYTLKIGDSAYYADITSAVISGIQNDVNTIIVDLGHGVIPGDTVYFIDSSDKEIQRLVTEVTENSITISLEPVSVNPSDPIHSDILVYKTSLVFGNVAIINGNQSSVTTLTVKIGHTIQVGDIVGFLDSNDDFQRRNILAVTANTISISGIPVFVSDGFLISSENQRISQINLLRLNANPATLGDGAYISNNLRINIYRTKQGESFLVNGFLYLIASIPNNSFGLGSQIYTDGIPDSQLVITYSDPDRAANPPPISKYVKAFGNQLFFGGGERGKAENSDNVFFSNGNAPEVVPLATNFFTVPNSDDDVTGLGISGTTFVATKQKSLWAATGNFLTGQIEVVQIASGKNIGCTAHATICSVGPLMYFLHTNGVYAITENQLFPTDSFGNPVPISLAIDVLFRVTPFLSQFKFKFKRAVALNYTKDNQFLLFLPCENENSQIRTANQNSIILSYDYEDKNWFLWDNMNAAGGMLVINDDLYFQERRFSGIDGNTANLYKQHRFYRLIDHADHASPQRCQWKSSWEDQGQPEVRKKFCRAVLLMDRLSELQQYNNPEMYFSSYVNRLPNLQSTMVKVTQVDNIRNSSWSFSGWGWNFWSGYQDSFIAINLKQGTTAKSIQIGFTIKGINMDISFAGFQLEIIPENRKSILR